MFSMASKGDGDATHPPVRSEAVVLTVLATVVVPDSCQLVIAAVRASHNVYET